MQQNNALGEGLGLQVLLAAGGLTGILQIAWGYLRLTHQMRFVGQPVMASFVPRVLRSYRGWSAQGIQSEPMA